MLLLALTLLATARCDDPVYGAEPWLWYGNPVAAPAATLTSASGKHRFTILTPSLLRLEFSPTGAFEDHRTFPIMNRLLPVPAFSVVPAGPATTAIDTGALLLTHVDDGQPFSDASLSVLRRTPALWGANASTWTPSRVPASDPGQLFGTFHNLDGGHDGYEVGGLNCSLLNPNAFGGGADYFPCDFGLLSKGGFALVDDSRTPVWDEAGTGWLQQRPGAACPVGGEPLAPCFPGGFDTTSAQLCEAAGCCLRSSPVTLSLWYSKHRNDHFSDSLNCTGGCGGLDYVYMHAQAQLQAQPGARLVPLNLYWNAAPGVLRGALGDNVASTFPPAQQGYGFARVLGWVSDPALPAPPGSVALKLFYSAAGLDHWTTAGPADEAAAAAAGYALVGLVGYAAPPPAPPAPPPPALTCAAPSVAHSATDWYLFGHGANYSGALADYVAVAGPVAIPRRHWMGVSWSTWDESNTANATLAQVEALVGGGWPLDTYM